MNTNPVLPRCSWLCILRAVFGFIALTHQVVADEKQTAVMDGQRILFTGHSFHIPLIPFIEQIAQAAQINGHQTVAKQMIGGSRVMQHWELPEDRNIAKTTLRAGGVDVLTMAPNWVVPDEAIEKFLDLGLEKNPSLRALVQVSWYPWDGLQPPMKVARNEDRDAKTVSDLRAVYDPFRETIRDQIRAINTKHGTTVAFVVPVGEAVLRLREQVIAGKVPGITKQSELFRDQIGHGKATIHQLAAYCQFACMYRRSPVGLTCFEDKKPASKELNHLLQTIAWQSVLAEPLSGVKQTPLSAAAELPQTGVRASRPNILLILADDLGYGELGCQGNTQIPTPHIDSIAANGIRFTSGYVSGPVCSPTRSGLMAGRYQQRFGREFNPGIEMTRQGLQALWPKETTFAQHMKAAGYSTGMFGKWHLGFEPEMHPLQRGFDEFVGFLGSAHTYLDVREGKRDPISRGTTPLPSVEHTTETFGHEACAFIERHKAEPWFIYLPFNAVHAPLESTKPYLERITSIEDEKRHTFAAMLTALDDAVGKLLATLRTHGLEDDTLIFFLSDNGGPTSSTTSMNKPLRGAKMQTWEGGVRVPFLAQWKGHFPAGKVDDRPIIQLDLLPTALAAAGVEVKPEWHLDGVNLLPYLTGENAAAPHDTLFWRMGEQMAVRVGDWKLVKASEDAGDDEKPSKKPKGDAKLFNLANDISEQKDLAASEPERVRHLAALWEKWSAEMPKPAQDGVGRTKKPKKAK